MTAPRDLELDVGWGSLAALAWPNPDAPRALCLHGWMDNAASFVPLAPFLDRLDLVALDYAGHGRSSHRPAGARYYLSDYAFDIDAALDALGWEDCFIIGHSLGSGVGVLYADAAPSRVRKLVMVDGVGPVTADDDRALEQIQKSLRSVRRPHRHERVYPTVDDAARTRAVNTQLALPSARLLAERALCSTEGGFRWRTDARLLWTSPILLSEAQCVNLLRGIQCPVLVLATPKLSEYLGPRADTRIAVIPEHVRVDIPGGHHVHMDAPGRVAPAILDFLLHQEARA